MHEAATKKILEEAGYILTQQERGYFEAPQQISGHLDTFISHPKVLPGRPKPAEIKGLNPAWWGKIESYQDMLNHKSYIVRKYPAQLQTYIYMTEIEDGFFILKNKQTGQIKFIHVPIDLAYVEGLLQKAEKINALVASGDHPDECTDDTTICAGCPFRHICFSDKSFGEGMIILDDEQIVVKINEMLELEGFAAEYARLKEEIGDSIKAQAKQERPDDKKAQFMIGDYVLSTTRYDSTKYNVPKDIKAQYAVPNIYWKFNGVIKL